MHDYCRALLKEIMPDVCKHVSVEDRKRAWTWKPTAIRAVYEFHGPNDFYWYGSACCKWHARYEGWGAYLRQQGVEGYADE